VNPTGQMQIGEVAERIGLSLRTIRYYEEVGLAVPSARSEGGFRLYVESDVERLRVIMQMKPLGFSLEEMRELLQLLDAGGAADPGRLTAFREQAAERVATLRRQLRTAEEFAARLGQAPSRGSSRACEG
jgi:MerR family transcriptional regulator, copper efflux regulator